MKKYFLFSVIIITAFCCSKDDSDGNKYSGKWVRVDLITDTIDFNFIQASGDTMFLLRRSQSTLGNSGFYSYRVAGDSISLQWGLSSCMYCPEKYFFDFSNSAIFIGNFIEEDDRVLEFRKL